MPAAVGGSDVARSDSTLADPTDTSDSSTTSARTEPAEVTSGAFATGTAPRVVASDWLMTVWLDPVSRRNRCGPAPPTNTGITTSPCWDNAKRTSADRDRSALAARAGAAARTIRQVATMGLVFTRPPGLVGTGGSVRVGHPGRRDGPLTV